MNSEQSTNQLIPRRTLFGNPDKTQAGISPDGAYISYLAPRDGVLNVWVAPIDRLDEARAVTRDAHRGIREYFWAYTNRHVFYLQDTDGDENWHIFCVDLDTDQIVDLTPIEGVQARVQEVSHKFPDEILAALNDREPQLHDLYRINIRTAQRTRVLENPGFIGFESDDFEVRLALTMTADGGCQFLKPSAGGEWELFIGIGADDTLTTGPVGFDKSGAHAYFIDSRDRNTAALVRVNMASGEKTTLAADEHADVGDVYIDRVEKIVYAASFTHERKQWHVLDAKLEADFAALQGVADGELSIESRTLDERQVIAAFDVDNGPRRYYRYDGVTRQAQFLFTNRQALEDASLARMQPVIIESRDGQRLISYLTLPVQAGDTGSRPEKPLPMVLLVHGGPWARDEWGHDPWHQWLANRGYAVLSVNFRGSTGFGKEFINSANLQWGATMHDDLLDAVSWAVAEGYADAERVALMGGSYGGYAVLWALTNSPEVFACGVDIVGPSNLITLLESIPPYWEPMIDMFATRVGDHRTDEGQRLLTERSPLTHVDRIRRPLLIGQGANDPRVKQAESDQIVAAMQAKGIPVTYVLYSDEGHGFARPENSLSFNAVAEAFLARHLGGRCEPVGSDFEDSTIAVPTGDEQVPGLRAALAAR
ncbi:MAG: S9 family peptidase [Planctomycetota bacterium]